MSDLDISSVSERTWLVHTAVPCLVAPTPEDFSVASRDSPVLITNMNPVADPTLWTTESMIERFGSNEVLASGDRTTTSNGDHKAFEPQTLGKQLKAPNDDAYVFDHSILNWAGVELGQSITVPEFLGRRDPVDYYILALGGAGTGAALHQHGASWCCCVRGSKLWVLYPPTVPAADIWETTVAHALAHSPGRSGKQTVVDVLKALDDEFTANTGPHTPLCVLQRAGDFLCLPPKWHHATVNLEPNTTSVVRVKRSFKYVQGMLVTD